ncbi:MAG: bifunctional glutamate N-acetyltransferase/amino-acid acetyltransferase ArgJ [Planctomycetota bacterium]
MNGPQLTAKDATSGTATTPSVKDLLPGGFRFAGVTAGIKASGKPDVSLIAGNGPLIAAGVYTQNQIVAAPVLWCRQRTPSGSIRAVVTVSGNANACTGTQGVADNRQIASTVAQSIGCHPDDVLVMSTGVIGQSLPMPKVLTGLENVHGQLGTLASDFCDASDAILTTDQARKISGASFRVDENEYRILAMAKGAGMIAPNMATFLCVMMTDYPLSPDTAQSILTRVSAKTFNCVSVDGHTSTNDTCLLLSSAAARSENTNADHTVFEAQASEVALQLAKRLVADGEGATHYIALHVIGADSDTDAGQIARTVAASNLVKTAITGGDPNWGRIVSAAGYAPAKLYPDQVKLSICGVDIYRNGTPLKFDAAALSAKMKSAAEVPLHLVVGPGPGSAMIYASDLTCDYVRFNSEYTT